MRDRVVFAAAALFLASPTLWGAESVSTRLRVREAVTAAPAVFPVPLGGEPLGTVTDVPLEICFHNTSSPPSACDASGRVQLVNGLAVPFFLGGPFRVAGSNASLTSFPVNLQAGQRLEFVVTWATDRLGSVADNLVLRATPTGEPAEDITVQLSGSGQVPGPCFPTGNIMCLNNNRFAVQGNFLTGNSLGGQATGVELTADTGFFWFFDDSNVEVVLKVLNACPVNQRFWVFAGGLTNVQTVVTVTDTQRNSVKTYRNPQGTPFAPIQDTSAFATCP
jgi:hypothetical protein